MTKYRKRPPKPPKNRTRSGTVVPDAHLTSDNHLWPTINDGDRTVRVPKDLLPVVDAIAKAHENTARDLAAALAAGPPYPWDHPKYQRRRRT